MAASIIHLLVPRTAYARLIDQCDPTLPVHEHLVNGIIEKTQDGHQRVRIFCDELQEKQIYDFVQQVHPELVTVIDRMIFTDQSWCNERLIA